MLRSMQLLRAFFVAIALSGCGGSPPPSNTPPTGETPTSDPPSARSSLTADECTAQGGTVVGDIGDGATQRPDYKCPSGAPPKGNIAAPANGPIGVEGSVCCAK